MSSFSSPRTGLNSTHTCWQTTTTGRFDVWKLKDGTYTPDLLTALLDPGLYEIVPDVKEESEPDH